MESITSEVILIVLCGVVVLSYLFSIASRYIRIPSVLLLLLAGIALRLITDQYNLSYTIPQPIVEILGTVGLIMIVLEAGLDLRLGRDKLKLIRNSFGSALIIFVLSVVALTYVLHYWLQEPLIRCLVYAIPLSIISSSIVLPSLHALTDEKREFLVYEASFSDIIGIVVFNYFTAREVLTTKSFLVFGGNSLLSILLSFLVSFLLLVIMARTKLNIKFFLVFAILVLLYAGGKILHLPSLIIILVFGLLINNWDKIRIPMAKRFFPVSEVENLRHLLHSITAESSFLIRTFFFILFGYSMQLSVMKDQEVLQVGGIIVLILFLIRFIYLRLFVKTNLFPELMFMPRGLITVVLFYKIPAELRLESFNEGILFFVILTTGLIMSLGMILYRKKSQELVEEQNFQNEFTMK